MSTQKPSVRPCILRRNSGKEGKNEHCNDKNRHHGDDSDFTNIIDMFIGYEVKPQSTSTWLGLSPIYLL